MGGLFYPPYLHSVLYGLAVRFNNYKARLVLVGFNSIHGLDVSVHIKSGSIIWRSRK